MPRPEAATVEAYKELQKTHLTLFARAGILDSGGSALIVDHQDGTISKIFTHPAAEITQNEQWRSVKLETGNLQAISSIRFQSLDVPRLLSDVEPIEKNETFFAHYRMTKISGHPVSWNEYHLKYIPEIRRHFQSAGRAIAEFHSSLSSLKHEWQLTHDKWRGGEILPIPDADDEINKAIERANDYFQAGRKAAAIHGDLHASNFMMDKDCTITGLLDFNLTGWSGNHLSDFSYIPPEFLDYFLEGYEDASREKIDPDMIKLSILSEYVSQVGMPENSEDYYFAIDELKKCLGQLSHITGYSPPHFG